MIAIGTAPDDWSLYREIARVNPGFVHYAVGLHPCSVEADWAGAVAQIEAFWNAAAAPLPVALGEAGLDRFHLPKDQTEADKIFGWQRAAFAAQNGYKWKSALGALRDSGAIQTANTRTRTTNCSPQPRKASLS